MGSSYFEVKKSMYCKPQEFFFPLNCFHSQETAFLVNFQGYLVTENKYVLIFNYFCNLIFKSDKNLFLTSKENMINFT